MIVRYEKNDAYTPTQLVDFLVQHIAQITILSCEETLQESDTAKVCDTLRTPEASLETLRLPNNAISPKAAESLAKLLFTNTTITELDLRHNELGPVGLAILIHPLLSANTTLRTLCLKNNHLTSKAGSSIASLIRHCPSLEELHLGNNDMTHRGIGRCSLEIAKHSLKRLHLAHNHLGSKGIAKLVKDLGEAHQHRLLFLDLTCNQAGNKGMQAIMGWLLYDRTLQKFWLSSNDLGPPSGGMWSSVLVHNYTLVELRLGGNQLGNEGASDLAKGLWENHSLVHLELDWNQIGDFGGKAIAKALTKNGKLQVVDLNGNQITREGGMALAKALPYHLQLRELRLDHNRLDDQVAFEFGQALLSCGQNFQTIQYTDNSFTEEGVHAIEQALRYRGNFRGWLKRDLQNIQRRYLPNLNWLDRRVGDPEVEKLAFALSNSPMQPPHCIYLGGQDITTKSMEHLCTWMESCQRLTRFYLRDSKIGDQGAAQVGNVLARNRSLEVLSVTSSCISAWGANAIADGLALNSTLTRLNLGNNLLRDEGCLAIGKALSANSTLVSLNIMSNQIRGTKVQFWEALVGTNVRELHMGDNLLTDDSTWSFAQALVDGCPFSIINLSGNEVSAKGAKVLSKFLDPATSLLC
jgi:Ran GTPase-activating protein (RanGAP) involved in mRNA processing and transport